MDKLKLAENISIEVNNLWQSGELLNKVSYTSAELLKYWFGEEYCVAREKNFHKGQKQAILNTIYLHEVAKINNVLDIHEHFAKENLLFEDEKVALTEEKYSFPKYCVKMATGTGKTWVMHALIIWQILNYQREKSHEGRFTNNFLLIAPGKIVYERLLDAFKGKINPKNGERNFDTNDFKLNEELFIPHCYRDEVYGFLQNNVKDKDNIDGITSGGLIAITNWHIFIDKEKEETEENDNDTREIIKDLLPAKPGKSAGNSLEVLDNNYLKGKRLEYLSNLDSLMIINDEAHHLHDTTTANNDVVWQQGIDYVLQNKTKGKLQIDFSATPYTTTGGKRKTKIYFPHIIADFDSKTAMREGLVKLINLVRREELTNVELSYKAIRSENNDIVGLSEGQRIMLSAGLGKLDILDEAFKELSTEKDNYKQPKMLVMCEDTKVSPLVVDFLISKGLSQEDIMQIDSNKEGEVSDEEWKKIKSKLFNIDNLKQPRVIVSVLMLREGFDVNNICVIVPLRTTDSTILLEQTIGRGLRLMFREKEFDEAKEENRKLLFSHKEPNSMIDMLSIVEHPNFIQYYNELLDEGFATIQSGIDNNDNVKGDLISVSLKEDYEDYDLYFPKILRSEQEELQPIAIDLQDLKPFDLYSLEHLQKLLAKDGEVFNSTDVLSTTHFGKYEVNANPFTANTYNEYLQKILFAIINYNARTNKKSKPLLQINNAYLVASIDNFIRHRLFDCEFNPFENNNWKILLVSNGIVTIHIQKEFSSKINDSLMNIEISSAQINKRFFSEVQTMLVRKEYSVRVEKSIFSYLPFPSNGGGLEKNFMEYIDRDAEVESFIKINEYKHRFANIYYVNEDGLLHSYYPDFIVKTKEKFYIIETKGKDRISSENVKRKRTAILEWVERINKVTPSLMDYRVWEYVLLRDDNFYNYEKQGISFVNMCNLNKVTSAEIKETLF